MLDKYVRNIIHLTHTETLRYARLEIYLELQLITKNVQFVHIFSTLAQKAVCTLVNENRVANTIICDLGKWPFVPALLDGSKKLFKGDSSMRNYL